MVYEWLGLKIGSLAGGLKIGFVEKGLSIEDINCLFYVNCYVNNHNVICGLELKLACNHSLYCKIRLLKICLVENYFLA